MKTTLMAVILLTLVISCSKSKTENTDREAPMIILTAPADQQVFPTPQLIHITGTVNDNKYLKEIHLEVSDLNTGEEYLHVHIHPAAASYNFNQSFQLKSNTSYRIRVIADDASTNSSVVAAEIRSE